jgi:hypothetical protein
LLLLNRCDLENRASSLSSIARANPGLVEVIIRGQPALHEFDNFENEATSTPSLNFKGPCGPADLPQMYGEAHFTWAIDYFDEGLNSAWLLPNRIYEGGLFGSIPLIVAGTETARWTERHRVGDGVI